MTVAAHLRPARSTRLGRRLEFARSVDATRGQPRVAHLDIDRTPSESPYDQDEEVVT